MKDGIKLVMVGALCALAAMVEGGALSLTAGVIALGAMAPIVVLACK